MWDQPLPAKSSLTLTQLDTAHVRALASLIDVDAEGSGRSELLSAIERQVENGKLLKWRMQDVRVSRLRRAPGASQR